MKKEVRKKNKKHNLVKLDLMPPKPLNPLHHWGARNSMNNEIMQINAPNNKISGYLFIYCTKCFKFWVRREAVCSVHMPRHMRATTDDDMQKQAKVTLG